MDAVLLVPIVAILATFAVPIVAIVMDFRRRKLMFEERRAMIERGMDLPPLKDARSDKEFDPATLRERSLRAGILLLFLGIGLAVAAWLLHAVLDHTFIPLRLAGPLAVGAAIVGFLGLGNLLYFAVTAKRGSTPTP